MEYYNITGAAAKIGISRISLWRYWTSKGLIKVETIAGHPMISVAEIERIKAIRDQKAGNNNE